MASQWHSGDIGNRSLNQSSAAVASFEFASTVSLEDLPDVSPVDALCGVEERQADADSQLVSTSVSMQAVWHVSSQSASWLGDMMSTYHAEGNSCDNKIAPPRAPVAMHACARLSALPGVIATDLDVPRC